MSYIGETENRSKSEIKQLFEAATLLKKISNTNEAPRIADCQDTHLQATLTNQELKSMCN